MNKIDTSVNGILTAKHIYLIPIVLSQAPAAAKLRFRDMVIAECGFDIFDFNVASTLTPEQVKKLQQFEAEHADLINEMVLYSSKDNDVNGISETKHVTAENSTNMKIVYIAGAVFVLLAFVYVFTITWFPIPSDNLRLADTALGFIMGSICAPIINRFFGTNFPKQDITHTTTETKLNDETKTTTSETTFSSPQAKE